MKRIHNTPQALLILLTLGLSSGRCTTKTSVPSTDKEPTHRVSQPIQKPQRTSGGTFQDNETKKSKGRQPALSATKPSQKSVKELAEAYAKKSEQAHVPPLLEKPKVIVQPSIRQRQANVEKILQNKKNREQSIHEALKTLKENIKRAKNELEAIAVINDDILRYTHDLDQFSKRSISGLKDSLTRIRRATNPNDPKALEKVNEVGLQFSNLEKALAAKRTEAKNKKEANTATTT